MIKKDSYNFPRVQKLLHHALTGKHNAQELVDIANNELLIRHRARGKLSNKKVTKNYVLGMLRNPFHAGIIKYDNEQSPGAHEAMISEQEHERLLELYGTFDKRGGDSPMTKMQERRRKYEYKLQGLFRCPCGRQVSPWRVKNREGGTSYVYYSCGSRFGNKKYRCGQPAIRAEELEAQVLEKLKEIQIDSRLLEWVKDNLDEELERQGLSQKEMITTLKKRKEQLELSKKRLLDHLLSGTIANEAYQIKEAELDLEIRVTEKELGQEEKRVATLKHESQEAIKIADKLVEIFNGDDYFKTKQMLRSVFESMKLEYSEVRMSLKRPFLKIQSHCCNPVDKLENQPNNIFFAT